MILVYKPRGGGFRGQSLPEKLGKMSLLRTVRLLADMLLLGLLKIFKPKFFLMHNSDWGGGGGGAVIPLNIKISSY